MKKEKPKFGFKEVAKIVVGAGAILGGLYLGYNKIKYGQAFLDENIPDQSLLPEPMKRCFIEYDSRKAIEKRLDEIENLLNSSSEVEFEASILLVCATLERLLLKKLHDEAKNVISKKKKKMRDHKGMVDVARSLLSYKFIDREEYDQIVGISSNVRNPTVHGQFGKVVTSEALNSFQFLTSIANKFGVQEI